MVSDGMASGEQPNRHCSVVVIEGAGVLIEGRSGAGKTSLALGLIDTAKARGMRAVLVSDDQALLEERQGRLFARAPEAIAGRAEIRGYGIVELANVDECAIALVARLVEDERIERMPEARATTLMGVEVAAIDLPERHEQQATRIVLAWLKGSETGLTGDS